MSFKKVKKQPREKRPVGRVSNPWNVKGTLEPLWDLYRDGLTQGSISLFLQCREQFRLKMLEGLSHKMPSEAIEFGSTFHGMLSDIQGKDWSIPKAARAYLALWKRNKSLTPSDLERIGFIIETASSTLKHYLVQWEAQDAKKKWIAREQVFKVPVEVRTVAGQILSILLTGRWDGIFSEGARKTPWLFETKTKSQIDEDGLLDSLPFDLQTMLYCLAAEIVFKKKMRGTIYDVVRRPGLRQGQSETLTGFCERIDRDIKSRPAHYFKRYQVNLGPNDVPRFLDQQLQPILREVVSWYTDILEHLGDPFSSPSHYMNSTQLFTRFGKTDLFAKITRDSNFGLYRRPFPYMELID